MNSTCRSSKTSCRFLPSVSIDGGGPGNTNIYMRGVVSGGDGNHSASLPSVGIYLDEQPITTIGGALDVHMYDIARVEALAGPQGTLFGASSQSGTIRIITNKPDPTGFDAGYGVELNTVSGGSEGYLGEGFVNIPLNERTAIRLVGWARRDGGFVDNIPYTRPYPSSGIVPDNSKLGRGRLQRRRHLRRACRAALRHQRQLDRDADGDGPGAEGER